MKYSLCCISLNLQESGIKASIITKTRFLSLERKAAERVLADRTYNNVVTVRKILEFCASKKWNYRISSGMMPLETLPDLNLKLEDLYNYSSIKSEFDRASEFIKSNNIRCSTHPDQFVVPASANPLVAAKSVIELNMHGKMMDLFGLSKDYNSPINIHMNCFKGGDIKDIANRFIDIYHQLQPNVKNRLVLETEDKPNSWNVEQLYNYIFDKVKIPITYDSHHFRLNNPSNIPASEAIKMCMSTWGSFKPLFHFSNGKSSKLDRSHSDYVYDIHEELFQNPVDIEFEFKMKDHAIEKFVTDFPQYNIKSCV
jgi:UV DNA damage endonuclease